MRNRTRISNIVCAILCVLLAGGMVYMYYTYDQQEKAQEAALTALREATEPLKEEMQELEDELDSLDADFSYYSEEAEIMVGFVVSDDSDIDYISEMASEYDFAPVLVIDCTMQTYEIRNILEEADDAWEIMLYVPEFSEETNEDVLSVLSYLEDEEVEQTGVFFLLSDDDKAANIRLLGEDGFIGYTVYNSDSPSSGQMEDGTIYFDYAYLSSEDDDVESRISELYTNKASMIFVLDMESVNAEELTEEYLEDFFDMLVSYVKEDDCSFATVEDVVEELSEINSIEAENQENYDKRVEEIQERLNELQESIDILYDEAEY